MKYIVLSGGPLRRSVGAEKKKKKGTSRDGRERSIDAGDRIPMRSIEGAPEQGRIAKRPLRNRIEKGRVGET